MNAAGASGPGGQEEVVQMRTHDCARWLAVLACMCGASTAFAQIPHDSDTTEHVVALPGSGPKEHLVALPGDDPHAIPSQYNLSGPRLGVTFAPDGSATSQFGWHFEHQIEAGERGPSLLVESVVLVGGVEQHRFIPNWTLIFGMRTPGGFEFGLGPSLTLGTAYGYSTGVVAAAGRTFRISGVQIPLNLAYAFDKNGERISVITGWAIRRGPSLN
jgi:hypothetical protein